MLRCGKLYFESLSKIPVPSQDPSAPSLWLVLDEVVDPQNLGALLIRRHELTAPAKTIEPLQRWRGNRPVDGELVIVA